ncbi:DUF3108 domain-containing protein [Gangjinia marincola]|uniref:DUF3108 domain-containing protein n=1 Tax=Gangjinia marincola TaxID=578463 RepID=A0ABP3XWX9_9FLAO
MKKFFLVVLAFAPILSATRDVPEAYESGEWFKFRIHYGWFNASYATLEVKDKIFNNQPVHHVLGKGKSTGLLDLFFKVDDRYETYIHKETNQPIRFIRKINEGGYIKNRQIDFDHSAKTALVIDKKRNTEKTFTISDNVQDMLSAFYYLRNRIDITNLTKGEEHNINLFFDDENYVFRTKFLGKETIKTNFGKIKCLKFRPYVQAGRVFKEQESVTFYVSDDKNKMPVKIEAKLAVGSLEADLIGFKGLKNPFVKQVD